MLRQDPDSFQDDLETAMPLVATSASATHVMAACGSRDSSERHWNDWNGTMHLFRAVGSAPEGLAENCRWEAERRDEAFPQGQASREVGGLLNQDR